MSAAPWKKYNRLQEIAERYEIPTDELLHLASQGRLTLYGCLPSGVRLRKGPGGEFIGAQFVRFNQGDAKELELRGKVTMSQFDTAVSVIGGVCIEHDSVGRHLNGLVDSVFNRFSTKDGEPVTFERNDIFLIHERNMAEILRDDLWRSSVLDREVAPECADIEAISDSENPDVFASDGKTATGAEDAQETQGVSKREILCANWPLASSYSMKKLEDALGGVSRILWLQPARVGQPGAAGKESHRWNPAILASCLCSRRYIVNKIKLLEMFEKQFPEYLNQWEEITKLAG